jgi:hypothetical protein
MANTSGEKELRKDWPVTDGLTAETTKQTGHKEQLIAEQGSMIPKRLKAGMID